ncbi:MAG: FAD-dependent oxidoreductase [Candidatus Thermoplasmatota archaeon]|nr:FAD-dependent oxidoreductase [Candidatus Thermoplasmatota archaeon]
MRVTILGGGFCGAMVAKNLDDQKDPEVSLIDKNDRFEYYPSLPKLLTEPSHQEKIIKPYSEFLDNTEIITEEVVEITPEYFSTKSKKIPFDISVISIGARYPIYLDDERDVFTISSVKEVKDLSKRIEEADRILIVGGGLIGTETAAELGANTEKEITLVHSHERLIERNSKMASYLAERFLEEKNVKLILDQKVVDRQEKMFKTDDGKELEADICIWSTGLSYDESIFSGFEPSSFADDGSLRVNEHLQVRAHPNVFAGGDITDTDEEKTGHNADSHSKVISENIRRKAKGRSLKNYSRTQFPLLISLGQINGLLSLPKLALPGPVPALIKHLLEKGALLRF